MTDSAPAQRARVVIADDHELARLGLRTMLVPEPDLEVVGEATTGREAVDLSRELAPDLVLMDVNLPGIDGVEAASRLAEGGAASTPVVVLLSTYDEDEFDRAGCGAAAYVSKASFSSERLQQVWQEATSEPQRPAAGS
jgi:DNA-binding NarL/FixJ family response regulator